MSLSTKYLKQRLFRELPDVFSHRNLGAWVQKRTAFRLIAEWERAGAIKKAGGRIYAKAGGDAYLVASQVFGGYISFSSALYVRGLKTETEKRIFVAVSSSKKPLLLSSVTIIPVCMRGFASGYDMVKRRGHDIPVATVPKTLFDMCHRPKYADFYSMYRAMNWRPFAKEDWEGLLKYAKMAPLSTVRRMGYIVEGKAPEWFIQKLEKLNKLYGVSFLYGKGGHYDKKWRIYDEQRVRRWIGEE